MIGTKTKLSSNSFVLLILKESYNFLAFVETRNRLKLHIEPISIGAIPRRTGHG